MESTNNDAEIKEGSNKLFQQIDEDKNGQLDMDEVRKFWKDTFYPDCEHDEEYF